MLYAAQHSAGEGVGGEGVDADTHWSAVIFGYAPVASVQTDSAPVGIGHVKEFLPSADPVFSRKQL